MLLLRLSCFLVGLGVYLGGVSVVQAATDCGAVTEISQIECESLLQLYQSTNGAQWLHNNGWNVTNTPCGWFGVTCENNGVTEIDLGLSSPGNNLTGTIPDFQGLPWLHRLELDNNQLTGAIPDLSGLPILQTRLSGNQLTGAIPDFSGLSQLQSLFLNGNQLTGAIPDFSGLPQLRELALYDNKLFGTIPDFSGLLNLEQLNFSGNQLTGLIPNLQALSNLQILYFSDNQLMGAIPDFSGLPKLLWFDISNNQVCKNPNIKYSKWLEQLSAFQNCLPLSAGFTVSPRQQGKAPLTVHLDANLSADYKGTIVQYKWTIEGQTLSGLQTSATFTTAGEYPIVLTVTDNHGGTATTQKTVTATTNCQVVMDISPMECESLLQLYQSTEGANWDKNDGWNVSETPCGWYGVSCNCLRID